MGVECLSTVNLPHGRPLEREKHLDLPRNGDLNVPNNATLFWKPVASDNATYPPSTMHLSSTGQASWYIRRDVDQRLDDLGGS